MAASVEVCRHQPTHAQMEHRKGDNYEVRHMPKWNTEKKDDDGRLTNVGFLLVVDHSGVGVGQVA